MKPGDLELYELMQSNNHKNVLIDELINYIQTECVWRGDKTHIISIKFKDYEIWFRRKNVTECVTLKDVIFEFMDYGMREEIQKILIKHL
jgi:hypothetical protein